MWKKCKLQQMRAAGRILHRWEVNIKIDAREVGGYAVTNEMGLLS
jgi:hypothetical protein